MHVPHGRKGDARKLAINLSDSLAKEGGHRGNICSKVQLKKALTKYREQDKCCIETEDNKISVAAKWKM